MIMQSKDVATSRFWCDVIAPFGQSTFFMKSRFFIHIPEYKSIQTFLQELFAKTGPSS